MSDAPDPAAPIDAPIELEPSAGKALRADVRPSMPEPPPVRLLAVADVHLPAALGREADVDAFYLDVLKFTRSPKLFPPGVLAYRADNVDLIFDLAEPPIERDNLEPTMLEVPSLRELRGALIEREIGFQSMKGLMPATEHVLLRDPAGNWLSVGGWRFFS